MLSGLPAPNDERRIIPFPRAVEIPAPGLAPVGEEEGVPGPPPPLASFSREGRGNGTGASPAFSPLGRAEILVPAFGFFRAGRGDGQRSQEPKALAPLVDHGVRPLPREEAARHYLKFMLPAIPIMMFVMAFVYCALLVGTGESVAASPSAVRMERGDSALPLVGALLLAGTSAALCVMIYLGYLRISGQERT